MNYLLIDTSNKYLTLAIFRDDVELYFFHEQILENLSVRVLPLIDEGLKKCNLNIRDINRIYVSTGPGSFTGIRIGVTIMKVIAWSLKIEIVPFSSLELIASTSVSSEYVVPYIDARRGNCYIAVYDSNLNAIKNDQFTNFNKFIANIESKSFKIVSYDSLNYPDVIFPQINILKVINKHKYDKPVNPHSLNPIYLKMTEAEENLKLKND